MAARAGDAPIGNSPDAPATLDRIDPALPSGLDSAGSGRRGDSRARRRRRAPKRRSPASSTRCSPATPSASFSLLADADRATSARCRPGRTRISTLPRYLGYRVTGADGPAVRHRGHARAPPGRGDRVRPRSRHGHVDDGHRGRRLPGGLQRLHQRARTAERRSGHRSRPGLGARRASGASPPRPTTATCSASPVWPTRCATSPARSGRAQPPDSRAFPRPRLAPERLRCRRPHLRAGRPDRGPRTAPGGAGASRRGLGGDRRDAGLTGWPGDRPRGCAGAVERGWPQRRGDRRAGPPGGVTSQGAPPHKTGRHDRLQREDKHDDIPKAAPAGSAGARGDWCLARRPSVRRRGLLPPGGTTHHRGSRRGPHGRVRVREPGRREQGDVDRQRHPVRGARRRPELPQVRRRRAVPAQRVQRR